MDEKKIKKEFVIDKNLNEIKIYRNFSIAIVKKLMNTCVTANHITLLGFFFFVASAFFFSLSTYFMILIGLLFFQLGYLCDYIDGSLARLKNESSDYGKWLDLVNGDFGWPLIFIGITVGVYKQISEPHVLWFGLLGALSVALKNVTQSHYQTCFKFTSSLRKDAYKKGGKLLVFGRYTATLVLLIFTLGTLFNKLYWALLFCGIYGPFYVVLQNIILTSKAKRKFLKQRKD